MPLTQLNQLSSAYKKLLGKAFTSPKFTAAEENLPSLIQLGSSTIFGEPIPTSPPSTLYVTSSGAIVEKVRFELVVFSDGLYTPTNGVLAGTTIDEEGDSTTNGNHTWVLKLSGSYQANSENPKAGTAPFIDGYYLTGSNGTLQIVPPSFGSSYFPTLYNSSLVEIPPLDVIDWVLDTSTGVLFAQDAPNNSTPAFLDAYIYIGDYLSTVVSESGGGGSGTGFPFSGSAVITGSLLISGSGTIDELVVSGNIIATQGFTGSLFGTASWANNVISASHGVTASYVNNLNQNLSITGSVFISGGFEAQGISGSRAYLGTHIVGIVGSGVTGSGLIISSSNLPLSHHNFVKIGNTELVDYDLSPTVNRFFINNVNEFYIRSGGLSDGGDLLNNGLLLEHKEGTFKVYSTNNSTPLTVGTTSTVISSNTTGIKAAETANLNHLLAFDSDPSSNAQTIGWVLPSKFITSTGSSAGQVISGSGNIHALRILGGSGSISALIVTGGLSVNGGITGSLLGTASWAITASHALNAIYTAGGGLSLASNIFSVNYGAAPNIITSANGLDGPASPTSDQIMFYHSNDDEVQTTNIGNFLSRYAGISSYAGNTTTLNGNLVVNGTASFFGSSSFINVQNLAIEDKFILLNSGSKGTPSHEGGIIIQTSASAGDAFGTAIFYDQNANRWMVAQSSSVAANATSIAVGATTDYIVTVSASVGAPTGAPVNFGDGGVGDYSLGQMYIQTNTSDIYIYA
jgi:hypothetical protein